MLDKDQIYIVVDMESDGPIPGTYSMLAIGAVATDAQKEIASFYRKLLPHKDAKADPDTVRWWQTAEPEGWKELQKDAEPPDVVMKDFYEWVKSFGKTPVFVAHPVWFDYGFVRWYLQTFVGDDPFHDYSKPQQTLDIASFISGKYSLPLSKSVRQTLPERLLANMPEHTHLAIDDTQGYAAILRNVLNDNES